MWEWQKLLRQPFLINLQFKINKYLRIPVKMIFLWKWYLLNQWFRTLKFFIWYLTAERFIFDNYYWTILSSVHFIQQLRVKKEITNRSIFFSSEKDNLDVNRKHSFDRSMSIHFIFFLTSKATLWKAAPSFNCRILLCFWQVLYWNSSHRRHFITNF